MEPIKTWQQKLTSGINSLAEEFGLDDGSASRMREFVFQIAKDQYLAGNRSGIRWARTQGAKSAS